MLMLMLIDMDTDDSPTSFVSTWHVPIKVQASTL
jgi:hypothetical protein